MISVWLCVFAQKAVPYFILQDILMNSLELKNESVYFSFDI